MTDEVFVIQVDTSIGGQARLWKDWVLAANQDDGLQELSRIAFDYPNRAVRLVGRTITEREIATNGKT
jgi:hypothetical protein